MGDCVRRPPKIILLSPYDFVVAMGWLQQYGCLPDYIAFYSKNFSFLSKEYSLPEIFQHCTKHVFVEMSGGEFFKVALNMHC